MRIYYAHCMDIYNTLQEYRDIDLLESLGFNVINPNKALHQERSESRKYANPMEYFTELVSECDALAFRAIPGMGIPAGVYREIIQARTQGLPVIELPNSTATRKLSIDDTRVYLIESGTQ
jgi:hypothetical protein